MQIAVIPGDGIGPEVIAQAVRVLKEVAHQLQFNEFNLGATNYLKTGECLSEKVLADLKQNDAILLGAIGDPRVKPGILERNLLLKLRFELDHYINLRPSKSYRGIETPLAKKDAIDILVVREGTEGPYAGVGGVVRKDTFQEVASEVSVNTYFGVSRTVRYAFEKAMQRHKRLTLVHKTNVLDFAGKLWNRAVDEISRDFPEVEVNYNHIDAACIHLVNNPQAYDVIVTDNLFGDIITDLAAAVTGGIGLAASANINASRDNPSMFEPVHGSAPDIAGSGKANPIAAILSAVLLLDFLNLNAPANKIEQAVIEFLAHLSSGETGINSKKLNQMTTSEIGDGIIDRLK